MRLALLFLVGMVWSFAQPAVPGNPIPRLPQQDKRLWTASLVTLAGAHALDSHSSWGKCETNPIVAGSAGTFDGRGVLLKSAVYAGLAGVEFLTARKHPRLYRLFSAVNFGVGAGLSGLAIRNYGIQPPSLAGPVRTICR